MVAAGKQSSWRSLSQASISGPSGGCRTSGHAAPSASLPIRARLESMAPKVWRSGVMGGFTGRRPGSGREHVGSHPAIMVLWAALIPARLVAGDRPALRPVPGALSGSSGRWT
jgi:hypothetical protein